MAWYNTPILGDQPKSLSDVFSEVRVLSKKKDCVAPNGFDPYGLGPNWYFLAGADCGVRGNYHEGGDWHPRYAHVREDMTDLISRYVLNEEIRSFDLIEQKNGDFAGRVKLFVRGEIGSQFVCWVEC